MKRQQTLATMTWTSKLDNQFPFHFFTSLILRLDRRPEVRTIISITEQVVSPPLLLMESFTWRIA